MPEQLDDLDFLTRLDPKGMLKLTNEFPNQCRRALEIAQGLRIEETPTRADAFILTGLGGSAAGGDFVKALFDDMAGAPFIVNRDYHIPNWVGLGSVVFCASYSGNTEETLSAYADAKKSGARIVAVTSGGKLAELARADGHIVIQIPGGQPPRTALGFMLTPVMVACEKMRVLKGLDYDAAFDLLEKCVTLWGSEAPLATNPAKQLAQNLQGKLPVLYGLGAWQGIVANRWKGQINENSKYLAISNVFPELNHNEILGWVEAENQGVDRYAVVLLEDGTESAKMKARAKVTLDLISDRADVYRVKAEGSTLLAKMLSLAFFGDYVSLYLAALNGVDPENIDWINKLKSELSRVV